MDRPPLRPPRKLPKFTDQILIVDGKPVLEPMAGQMLDPEWQRMLDRALDERFPDDDSEDPILDDDGSGVVE